MGSEQSARLEINRILSEFKLSATADEKITIDADRDIATVRAIVVGINPVLSVVKGEEIKFMGSGSMIPLKIYFEDQVITFINIASELGITGKVPPQCMAPVTKEKVEQAILTALKK